MSEITGHELENVTLAMNRDVYYGKVSTEKDF